MKCFLKTKSSIFALDYCVLSTEISNVSTRYMYQILLGPNIENIIYSFLSDIFSTGFFHMIHEFHESSLWLCIINNLIYIYSIGFWKVKTHIHFKYPRTFFMDYFSWTFYYCLALNYALRLVTEICVLLWHPQSTVSIAVMDVFKKVGQFNTTLELWTKLSGIPDININSWVYISMKNVSFYFAYCHLFVRNINFKHIYRARNSYIRVINIILRKNIDRNMVKMPFKMVEYNFHCSYHVVG